MPVCDFITHELKTPIAGAYAANDALLNFNQADEKTKRDKYLRICQEDLYINADRFHLSNIISNLIDNAVKYSPEQADISFYFGAITLKSNKDRNKD